MAVKFCLDLGMPAVIRKKLFGGDVRRRFFNVCSGNFFCALSPECPVEIDVKEIGFGKADNINVAAAVRYRQAIFQGATNDVVAGCPEKHVSFPPDRKNVTVSGMPSLGDDAVGRRIFDGREPGNIEWVCRRSFQCFDPVGYRDVQQSSEPVPGACHKIGTLLFADP